MTMTTLSSTESTNTIEITTEAFTQALHRYIDEYKPDPLSREQLEGWSMEWKNGGGENLKDNKEEEEEEIARLSAPAHILQGTLQIGGEYMVVLLDVECRWTPAAKEDDHKYGDLMWTCHARARFRTKAEFQQQQNNNSNDEKTTANNQKAQGKIFTKMIDRLKKDTYIAKLLIKEDKPNTKGPLLGRAKILASPDQLEERALVSEAICEAVQRAIWSSADTFLDVVEVLVQLPCLPTTLHSNTTTTTTTALANRAKLRLLEDAMCDACENEGDEELLDDLQISDQGKSRKKSKGT